MLFEDGLDNSLEEISSKEEINDKNDNSQHIEESVEIELNEDSNTITNNININTSIHSKTVSEQDSLIHNSSVQKNKGCDKKDDRPTTSGKKSLSEIIKKKNFNIKIPNNQKVDQNEMVKSVSKTKTKFTVKANTLKNSQNIKNNSTTIQSNNNNLSPANNQNSINRSILNQNYMYKQNNNNNNINNQNQKYFGNTQTPRSKANPTTPNLGMFFKEPLPTQVEIDNKDKTFQGYMNPITPIPYEQMTGKKTQRDNNFLYSPLITDQNMCFFLRTPNYASITPTPNGHTQFDFLSPGTIDSPYGFLNFFNNSNNAKTNNQNNILSNQNFQNKVQPENNNNVNNPTNPNINNNNSNNNSNSFTLSNPSGSVTNSIIISKSDE